MNHRVEMCSPEEAAEIIKNLTQREKPFLAGCIEATFRDACTGRVVERIHQCNVVTEYGRRRFMADGFGNQQNNLYIFTSPSRETPDAARHSLAQASNVGAQQANTGTPWTDGPSLTRGWGATFGAPAQNMTIGTVGLALNVGANVGWGVDNVAAYTLISPARVQTTSQTLEIAYRVTLNPVY